ASRRSTAQVRRAAGRAARRVAASGKAWTTSPSDESFTRAIRGASASATEPLADARDEVARRMVLRIADDGHAPARGPHAGGLGDGALRVVGALGMNV